jgi:hypothetical protein
MINGHVSTARTWEAGVRQGCPLAPAMYLFVVWALSCSLQEYKHPDTQQDIGIRLCGQRVTCSQYADDVAPLLDGHTVRHVAALKHAMTVFGDALGQRLNLDKCQLLLYGWPQGEPVPTAIAGMKVVTKANHCPLSSVIFSEQHSHGEPHAASVDWDELLKAVSKSY